MKVRLLTSADRIDPGRNPTCLMLPDVLASREIVDHHCIFAAFQEPTGRGYDQLSDVFTPAALQGLRAEGDFLRSTGRHLGGASTFSVNASPPDQLATDRAQIHTIERWLYDERDDADRRQRCFIEDSDQDYVMRLNGQLWIVDDFQVGGTRRADCPAGT